MNLAGAKGEVLVSEKFDVEGLLRRLTEDLPASLQAVRTDVEAHAGRVLRDATRKLDLVSREEFEAQSRVLERSRALITELSARVATLEQKARDSGR
jgi:ubiquinone biosynthesis accessory factor UbiK